MSSILKQVLRKISPRKRILFNTLTNSDNQLITAIKKQRLTYLSDDKLASIALTCRNIEDQKLAGAIIEAGCALGGSAILIAKLKQGSRPFYIYDVFDMIPPPTSEDGADVQQRYEIISSGHSKGLGKDKYYGYEKGLQKIVRNNLKRFDIDEKKHSTYLIKGLVQKTLKVNQPVVFAHIDVDWYEPVKVCLERIVPNLVIGGSVILDDYSDWSGCHKATDEYFKDISDQFEMDSSATSLKVTRLKRGTDD